MFESARQVHSILRPNNKTMWPSPNPILHIKIFMKNAFQSIFHSYSMIYFVISLMRLLLCFCYISYEIILFSSLQLTPGWCPHKYVLVAQPVSLFGTKLNPPPPSQILDLPLMFVL